MPEDNYMNKIVKIIIVPLVLVLASGPVRAQWDFFISGTDTTDCNDTYLRSNQPSNNYGLDATMLFGSQWNTMTLLIEFPHLPDSLALPAHSGNIDSALVGFVCTGAVESGDTLSMKAYTLKRNWSENQATWNNYTTSSGWQIPGAKGSDDRFDDASDDTLTLHSGNTGALDTVYIRLGENFGETYPAAVLEMSYEIGTEGIYLGFYSSDHSSAPGPFLHVFGGGAGGGEDETPPDAYDSFDIIAILNLNPDSVRLAVGAVDSTDLDRTIIRWDTASIPDDTTDGYSLYAGTALENDTSDYLLAVTWPNWVYFSIFALDEAGNASSVVSDSIYFPGGGEGGATTGRTNRMFEYLVSKQEKMTR